MTRKIDYQCVESVNKLAEIVSFQETIWGVGSVTVAPHLIAAIHNGGVVIGAYDEGILVGFCYGFPGFKDGHNILISHMMAVHPEYRDLGIGKQLKIEQKNWAKNYGYEKITWTFDSLESKNAFLNLEKLGGYVRTYVQSYYGQLNDEINQGLPADRFVLEWDLDDETKHSVAGEKNIIKLIDTRDESLQPIVKNTPLDDEHYLIAVPANIHEMKKENIELAKSWRFAHREIFEKLFSTGFAVVGMQRGNSQMNYYIVKK